MQNPQQTEQVWQDLHADLLSFIRRRVADELLADDLLQEVFLRIHDRMATLEDTQRLRAWVYQIARNAITDHYRSKAREAVALAEEEPFIRGEGGNRNHEVAQWLQDLVDSLPETYREAVRLSELEGLRQKEVAIRLGLSATAAHSRIQRGRAMLKELLLQCCHFELDQRGNILDFHRRGSCSCCERDCHSS